MSSRRLSHEFVLGLGLLVTMGTLPLADDAVQKTKIPATGQLKIAGNAVEKLILAKKGDDPQNPACQIIIQNLGSTVSLPTGDYTLGTIELKGGYRCDVPLEVIDGRDRSRVLQGSQGFRIKPDQPYVLKVGAPLKPKVAVSRTHRRLHLTHRFLDGLTLELYSGSYRNRDNRPRFTVYCNGRVVGSGSFEYG
jgi:hypothetical protein